MKYAAILMVALLALGMFGLGCSERAFGPAPAEYRSGTAGAAEHHEPPGGRDCRMAIYTSTY
jgi:hypothetical protein